MAKRPLPPTVVPATLVVSASNSLHPERADYRCGGINDHLVIQAALDALPATGGEVKLLDGTYHIEADLVLDSYQTLRGCGRNTILTTTTINTRIISATGGAGTEKVGILIADLCVDANSVGAHGIYWEYVDYSKIRNVWVLNCKSAIFLVTCDFNEFIGDTCTGSKYGFDVLTCCNNIISGNTCKGNTKDGILLDTDCNNNIISGNNCNGNTQSGIFLSTTCIYNTISGNNCDGNGQYGIYLNSSDSNSIIGNVLEGNDSDGIYVYVSNLCIVSNNTARGNGTSGINLAESDNCNVRGNICEANSQATDNTDDNIFISDSDYTLVASNTCRQGTLANKPKYGINIDSFTKRVIVQGNDLYSAGKTANFYNAGTLTIVKSDNREIEITQVRDYVYIKNTSGGPSAIGNVARHKAVAAGNEYDTPTAVGEDSVLGMVAEVIADNTSGYVQVGGKTTVLKSTNAGGNIAIGDYLCTEIGVRARLAAAGDMAFARALEACTAADCTIDALIISPIKI